MTTPREALAELVALSDLKLQHAKAAYRANTGIGSDSEAALLECDALSTQIARRQKPAWQAARAALAAVQPPLAAQSEQPQGNLAVNGSSDVHGEAGREAPTVEGLMELVREYGEQCGLLVMIRERGKHPHPETNRKQCWKEIRAYAERLGYRRPGADGWMPIATAPFEKDKATGCMWLSECLLLVPTASEHHPFVAVQGLLSGGTWLRRDEDGGDACVSLGLIPTHWQPLPAPPTGAAEGAKESGNA